MTNDDVFKFFRRDQTARYAQRLSHLLIFWCGRAADLAGGWLDVLLFDCIDNVGRHQTKLGHHVRFEPDAHAIVGTTEKVDLRDSGDAQQLIAQVDAAVVD